MNGLKSLLKFEWLQYFRKDNGEKKKKSSLLISFLTTIILCLVACGFTTLAFSVIVGEVDLLGYFSFLAIILQVILFFYSLTMQMKKILISKDKIFLASMPVSKWQIYLSKAIVTFIATEAMGLALYVPFVISFAVVSQLSVSFYIIGLILSVIFPILPFALASLISVPAMYVYNWLKNKQILKLVLSIIITIGGFYLYSEFVFSIADTILLQNSSAGNLLMSIAEIFANSYLPSFWLGKILVLQEVGKYLLLLVGSSVLLLAVSLLLGAVTYKNIFVNFIVQKIFAKRIKTKNKKKSEFKAFFTMEWKGLFRSANYCYTYLGMAVAMPIMVWLCNNFIINFAVEKIGQNIIWGTTLLVCLIFVSIICSPSASFISKEGDSYWIMKINPKGIKNTILAKSLVGFIVSSVASIVTFLMVISLKYINVYQAIIICVVSIVYSIGIICVGLLINLIWPNMFTKEKENNANLITLMFITFMVSLAIGVGSILLTFKQSLVYAYIMSASAVSIFAVAGIIVLISSYKKLFNKMEVG